MKRTTNEALTRRLETGQDNGSPTKVARKRDRLSDEGKFHRTDTQIILAEPRLGFREVLAIFVESACGSQVLRRDSLSTTVPTLNDGSQTKLLMVNGTLLLQPEGWGTLKSFDGPIVVYIDDVDVYVDLLRLAKAGANALVALSSPIEKLVDALNAALRNDQFIDPAIARRLCEVVASSAVPFHELDECQLQTLSLAAEGMSDRDMAQALHLSLSAVKKRLRIIINKLRVGNRTAAAALYWKSMRFR